jgi:hypothetical protein
VCVCLFVTGQRSKKQQGSITSFCYPALFESGFEGLWIQPISFQGAESSTNQVSWGWKFGLSGLEGLEVRPIRFRGTGNSANQVLWGRKFGQSGFEGLEFQPIRSFQCPIFVQSGLEGLGVQPITWFRCISLVESVFPSSEFSQSGFFETGRSCNQRKGPYFVTVKKLLRFLPVLNLWLVKKGYHLEGTRWNMEAASREWRPGGAPTND